MDDAIRAELYGLGLFVVFFVCLCVLKAKVDRQQRYIDQLQKHVIRLNSFHLEHNP